MLKPLLVGMLTAALFAQGIVHAEEAASGLVTADHGRAATVHVAVANDGRLEQAPIPSREIQSVGYQPGFAQHSPPKKGVLVIAIVLAVGVAVLLIVFHGYN